MPPKEEQEQSTSYADGGNAVNYYIFADIFIITLLFSVFVASENFTMFLIEMLNTLLIMICLSLIVVGHITPLANAPAPALITAVEYFLFFPALVSRKVDIIWKVCQDYIKKNMTPYFSQNTISTLLDSSSFLFSPSVWQFLIFFFSLERKGQISNVTGGLTPFAVQTNQPRHAFQRVNIFTVIFGIALILSVADLSLRRGFVFEDQTSRFEINCTELMMGNSHYSSSDDIDKIPFSDYEAIEVRITNNTSENDTISADDEVKIFQHDGIPEEHDAKEKEEQAQNTAIATTKKTTARTQRQDAIREFLSERFEAHNQSLQKFTCIGYYPISKQPKAERVYRIWLKEALSPSSSTSTKRRAISISYSSLFIYDSDILPQIIKDLYFFTIFLVQAVLIALGYVLLWDHFSKYFEAYCMSIMLGIVQKSDPATLLMTNSKFNAWHSSYPKENYKDKDTTELVDSYFHSPATSFFSIVSDLMRRLVICFAFIVGSTFTKGIFQRYILPFYSNVMKIVTDNDTKNRFSVIFDEVSSSLFDHENFSFENVFASLVKLFNEFLLQYDEKMSSANDVMNGTNNSNNTMPPPAPLFPKFVPKLSEMKFDTFIVVLCCLGTIAIFRPQGRLTYKAFLKTSSASFINSILNDPSKKSLLLSFLSASEVEEIQRAFDAEANDQDDFVNNNNHHENRQRTGNNNTNSPSLARDLREYDVSETYEVFFVLSVIFFGYLFDGALALILFVFAIGHFLYPSSCAPRHPVYSPSEWTDFLQSSRKMCQDMISVDQLSSQSASFASSLFRKNNANYEKEFHHLGLMADNDEEEFKREMSALEYISGSSKQRFNEHTPVIGGRSSNRTSAPSVSLALWKICDYLSECRFFNWFISKNFSRRCEGCFLLDISPFPSRGLLLGINLYPVVPQKIYSPNNTLRSSLESWLQQRIARISQQAHNSEYATTLSTLMNSQYPNIHRLCKMLRENCFSSPFNNGRNRYATLLKFNYRNNKTQQDECYEIESEDSSSFFFRYPPNRECLSIAETTIIAINYMLREATKEYMSVSCAMDLLQNPNFHYCIRRVVFYWKGKILFCGGGANNKNKDNSQKEQQQQTTNENRGKRFFKMFAHEELPYKSRRESTAALSRLQHYKHVVPGFYSSSDDDDDDETDDQDKKQQEDKSQYDDDPYSVEGNAKKKYRRTIKSFFEKVSIDLLKMVNDALETIHQPLRLLSSTSSFSEKLFAKEIAKTLRSWETAWGFDLDDEKTIEMIANTENRKSSCDEKRTSLDSTTSTIILKRKNGFKKEAPTDRSKVEEMNARGQFLRMMSVLLLGREFGGDDRDQDQDQTANQKSQLPQNIYNSVRLVTAAQILTSRDEIFTERFFVLNYVNYTIDKILKKMGWEGPKKLRDHHRRIASSKPKTSTLQHFIEMSHHQTSSIYWHIELPNLNVADVLHFAQQLMFARTATLIRSVSKDRSEIHLIARPARLDDQELQQQQIENSHEPYNNNNQNNIVKSTTPVTAAKTVSDEETALRHILSYPFAAHSNQPSLTFSESAIGLLVTHTFNTALEMNSGNIITAGPHSLISHFNSNLHEAAKLWSFFVHFSGALGMNITNDNNNNNRGKRIQLFSTAAFLLNREWDDLQESISTRPAPLQPDFHVAGLHPLPCSSTSSVHNDDDVRSIFRDSETLLRTETCHYLASGLLQSYYNLFDDEMLDDDEADENDGEEGEEDFELLRSSMLKAIMDVEGLTGILGILHPEYSRRLCEDAMEKAVQRSGVKVTSAFDEYFSQQHHGKKDSKEEDRKDHDNDDEDDESADRCSICLTRIMINPIIDEDDSETSSKTKSTISTKSELARHVKLIKLEKCKHVFHLSCGASFLANKANQTETKCPFCRTPLSS